MKIIVAIVRDWSEVLKFAALSSSLRSLSSTLEVQVM